MPINSRGLLEEIQRWLLHAEEMLRLSPAPPSAIPFASSSSSAAASISLELKEESQLPVVPVSQAPVYSEPPIPIDIPRSIVEFVVEELEEKSVLDPQEKILLSEFYGALFLALPPEFQQTISATQALNKSYISILTRIQEPVCFTIAMDSFFAFKARNCFAKQMKQEPYSYHKFELQNSAFERISTDIGRGALRDLYVDGKPFVNRPEWLWRLPSSDEDAKVGRYSRLNPLKRHIISCIRQDKCYKAPEEWFNELLGQRKLRVNEQNFAISPARGIDRSMHVYQQGEVLYYTVTLALQISNPQILDDNDLPKKVNQEPLYIQGSFLAVRDSEQVVVEKDRVLTLFCSPVDAPKIAGILSELSAWNDVGNARQARSALENYRIFANQDGSGGREFALMQQSVQKRLQQTNPRFQFQSPRFDCWNARGKAASSDFPGAEISLQRIPLVPGEQAEATARRNPQQLMQTRLHPLFPSLEEVASVSNTYAGYEKVYSDHLPALHTVPLEQPMVLGWGYWQKTFHSFDVLNWNVLSNTLPNGFLMKSERDQFGGNSLQLNNRKTRIKNALQRILIQNPNIQLICLQEADFLNDLDLQELKSKFNTSGTSNKWCAFRHQQYGGFTPELIIFYSENLFESASCKVQQNLELMGPSMSGDEVIVKLIYRSSKKELILVNGRLEHKNLPAQHLKNIQDFFKEHHQCHVLVVADSNVRVHPLRENPRAGNRTTNIIPPVFNGAQQGGDATHLCLYKKAHSPSIVQIAEWTLDPLTGSRWTDALPNTALKANAHNLVFKPYLAITEEQRQEETRLLSQFSNLPVNAVFKIIPAYNIIGEQGFAIVFRQPQTLEESVQRALQHFSVHYFACPTQPGGTLYEYVSCAVGHFPVLLSAFSN